MFTGSTSSTVLKVLTSHLIPSDGVKTEFPVSKNPLIHTEQLVRLYWWGWLEYVADCLRVYLPIGLNGGEVPGDHDSQYLCQLDSFGMTLMMTL
jgi:hypothetical protein